LDTQRLIAFVVFSFSALLLWDAWQKHNAPKPAPAAVIASPASVAQTPPPGAAPAGGATIPPAPAAVPAATAQLPGGEPVNVKTDLFEIELNTAGGDIRRATLLRVFSATDRTKPLTLMEPHSKHYFVTQSGLVGEGLPYH